MATAIGLRQFLTLQDLAGSQAIKHQEATPEFSRLLMEKWTALKTLPYMAPRMQCIENRIVGPIENKVGELFRELAKTCDTPSSFGDIIPVTTEPYVHLHQRWENEALFALWGVIRRRLGSVAPKLTSLTEIRDWLASHAHQLMNITSLYILNSKLRVIPPEIGLFTQLKTLGLSGNLISSIPPQIRFCTQLREIYLSDNLISSIPPEIGRCTQLQRLYLNNNKISSLPPEIRFCTQLQDLGLLDNPIFLPTPESSAREQELCLSNPGIPFIPVEVLSYVELQTLLPVNRMSVFLIETDQGNSDVRYVTKIFNPALFFIDEPCTIF
jgi:Leucine-rich repeat (LRR) protein